MGNFWKSDEFWKREKWDNDRCSACGHTEKSNPIQEYYSEWLEKMSQNKLSRSLDRAPICHYCQQKQTLESVDQTVNQIEMKKMGNFQGDNT